MAIKKLLLFAFSIGSYCVEKQIPMAAPAYLKEDLKHRVGMCNGAVKRLVVFSHVLAPPYQVIL